MTFAVRTVGLVNTGPGAPTTWVFTYSSLYLGRAEYTPTQAKLSDGDSTTRWGSENETAGVGHITADFGTPRLVSTVTYRPALASSSWGPTYVNGRTIESSNDGVTWVDQYTISNAVDGYDSSWTPATPFVARYVRLHNKNSGYTGVSEFWFS